jgi:DNA-binding transcriptional MerR regulator
LSIVRRLKCTPGQACSVVGITRPQLDYWIERASIESEGKTQRTFDWTAIQLLVLIKQARDLGLGLDASVHAAQEFMSRSEQDSHVIGLDPA